MPIEIDDHGNISATEEGVTLVALLAAWNGGSVEVCSTTGLKTRPSIFHWMSAQCGSSKRTHAGIMVDYTIYLATYGIRPTGTDRLRDALNASNRRTLDAGLRAAARVFERRKAEANAAK
jgi:hypothetical protein